jgi:hypothetical protein
LHSQALELSRTVPRCIEAANHSAETRRGYEVDWNIVMLEGFQNSDLRNPARTSTTEDKSYSGALDLTVFKAKPVGTDRSDLGPDNQWFFCEGLL